MVPRYLAVIAILCTAVLLSHAATAAVVAPDLVRSIKLGVDKSEADNGGGDSITFCWEIVHDTTCVSAEFEIEGADPPVQFPIPCEEGVMEKCYTWEVSPEQPERVCTGVLTFRSRLDGACGTEYFTDSARVQVRICPTATPAFCKFNDLNGDGLRTDDEPWLKGWTFVILECDTGKELGRGTTDESGCTHIAVPCRSDNTYCVREIPPSGPGSSAWERTTPEPGPVDSLFHIVCPCGGTVTALVGNWQPIVIVAEVLEDLAPWPWEWTGPDGQKNPSDWEPRPKCNPPDLLYQRVRVGVKDSVVQLWRHDKLLQEKSTDGNGVVSFDPVGWLADLGLDLPWSGFVLKQTNAEPNCECRPDDAQLCDDCRNTKRTAWPWPGTYVNTTALSPWASCPLPSAKSAAADPDELCIYVTVPDRPRDDKYVFNHFYDRRPARMWGMIQPATAGMTINASKTVDGTEHPWPAEVFYCPTCGFYMVEPLQAEPEGVRCACAENDCGLGLELSSPADPTRRWSLGGNWCCCCGPRQENGLPGECCIGFGVHRSRDVRIDFTLEEENRRRCFMPITLTQQGWHDFANINNTIIPGGMLYPKFERAFSCITYGGQQVRKLIVGKNRTITFEPGTANLRRLELFVPQTGMSGKLDMSYVNPWQQISAGALAGEAVALLLNIAYNDMRLMPRSFGYNIEGFVIAQGPLKGRRVIDALDIANRVLGGMPPCSYGLRSYDELAEVLANINGNYRFVNFDTFIDAGYLTVTDPLVGIRNHDDIRCPAIP